MDSCLPWERRRVAFADEKVLKTSPGKILIDKSPRLGANTNKIHKVWMSKLAQDIHLKENKNIIAEIRDMVVILNKRII